jgi:hypothetical protein
MIGQMITTLFLELVKLDPFALLLHLLFTPPDLLSSFIPRLHEATSVPSVVANGGCELSATLIL